MTELENYEHSVTGAPFSGIIEHDVVLERKKRGRNQDLNLNNFYVNYSNNNLAPSGQNAKFYDIGDFQLGCQGAQSGTLGELWVEYSFTLIRRLQPTAINVGGWGHWATTTGANTAPTTGLTKLTSTLPNNIVINSGGTSALKVDFPAGVSGTFMIQFYLWSHTSGTNAPSYSAVVGAGITFNNIFTSSEVYDNAYLTSTNGAASTAQWAIYSISVNIPTNLCSVVFNSFSWGGTTGNMDIFITALPSQANIALAKAKRNVGELDDLMDRINLLERKLLCPRVAELKVDSDESEYEEMERSVHLPRKIYKQLLDSSVVKA
jgi:hypothetical protein